MSADDIIINQVPKEDFETIDKWLDIAIDSGLEVEIIYFALLALKENPKLTPGEAFIYGISEWIK